MIGRLNHGSPNKPGIGLGVFTNLDYVPQLRPEMVGQADTWICPTSATPTFQFGFGAAALTSLTAIAEFGDDYPFGTAGITSVSISGSRKIHSYDGTNPLPTGKYYFRIGFFGGATCYTERFEVVDCADGLLKLVVYDSKDYNGGTYYGGGFQNVLWFRSVLTRPKVEFNSETKADGFGVPLTVYARTEDVYGFDALACDGLSLTLSRLANHDTATITYPGESEDISIRDIRASDTGEKSDLLAVVEVSFKMEFMETNTQSFTL